MPIAARRIIYGLQFQDPDVDVDINNIPMKFPLMEGWSKLLKLLPKKHPNVASFIELFGNLNEQQVSYFLVNHQMRFLLLKTFILIHRIFFTSHLYT